VLHPRANAKIAAKIEVPTLRAMSDLRLNITILLLLERAKCIARTKRAFQPIV